MKEVVLYSDQDTVVSYRISVRSFFDADGDGVGDIRGFIAKLPYLRFLGVNRVILTDLIEGGRNGVTNYMHVDPAIGMMDDLEDLVLAMHQAGLSLFVAFDPNVTACSHPWFEKSAATPDLNPYREYYRWFPSGELKGKKPPAGDRAKKNGWCIHKTGYWYLGDREDRPLLNYDNPRVRKEMIDVIRFWREKGIDGFVIENARLRLKNTSIDASKYYSNYDDVFEEGSSLFRFLKEIPERFSRDFPILLDADEMDRALFDYLCDRDNGVLDGVLVDVTAVEENGGSFDFDRFLKQYISVQNYPKSEAVGIAFEKETRDRLLSKIAREKDAVPAAKMLAALLLSVAPFPVVYQGEELGMTNLPKKLSEKGKSVGNPNGMAPFQWDNKSNAGFTAADFAFLAVNENYREINCMVESSDPDSVLSFYRKMIEFRRRSITLSEGAFRDHSSGAVVAFTRTRESESLLIVANTSAKSLNYQISRDLLAMHFECLLSSYSLVAKPLYSTIGLHPYEVRIYRSMHKERD